MEINNDTSLMMLAREDNKFLGSEELPKNNDLIVTISKIDKEGVLNPKTNKTTNKTIVHFVEPDIKPIVANKTNLTAIYRATGAETVGEVIGHKIALYKDPNVRFGTKVTGGIRVSPYPVDSDEYKRDSATRDQQYGRVKPTACEECGKEIRGAAGKSAAEIVQIGKAQYGKALCFECMKKAVKKENK